MPAQLLSRVQLFATLWKMINMELSLPNAHMILHINSHLVPLGKCWQNGSIRVLKEGNTSKNFKYSEVYGISSMLLKVKITQPCPTLCDPLGYTVHGILLARILEWVTVPFSRGSNPGLPHCRQILYQLSHQGSPRILEWVAYPFSSRSFRPRNRTVVSCIAGGFFTS